MVEEPLDKSLRALEEENGVLESMAIGNPTIQDCSCRAYVQEFWFFFCSMWVGSYEQWYVFF